VQGLKIIDLSDLALRCCEMLPRFIGEDIHLEVRPHKVSAFVCSTNSNRPEWPTWRRSIAIHNYSCAKSSSNSCARLLRHDNGPTSK
jgi:hypothetical protein